MMYYYANNHENSYNSIMRSTHRRKPRFWNGCWEDENVILDENALGNAIKKSLFEMNLTQKAGAELLGISPSRMSDLVRGRMEPSYRLSRK